MLSDITNIMSDANCGTFSGMRLVRANNIPCATPNDGSPNSTVCKILIFCCILIVELEVFGKYY